MAGIGGQFVGRTVQAVVESIVSEVLQATEHPKDVTKLARTEHHGHVRYAAPQSVRATAPAVGHGVRQPPVAARAAGMSRVMMATFASGAVSLAYPTIWATIGLDGSVAFEPRQRSSRPRRWSPG